MRMEIPFATAKPGNEEEAPEVPAEAEEPKPKRPRRKKEETPDPLTEVEHGNVGQAIFTEVELLVKSGATKQQAFDEIATRSGRKSGTVAANYYRVARHNGTVARPRKAKGVPAPHSLAGQVAEMERELRELREFKAKFEAILS